MEKIKIGEYIRNKYGEIGKITEIYPRYKWRKKKASSLLDYNLIKKHSFNIIDLIEVGDYVNGYICRRIPNFANKMCNFDLNEMEWIPLENIDIWYSVVTKEQFKSIEYRLEE